MFYQVNNFEVWCDSVSGCIENSVTTPFMITTDINKAIAAGEECLNKNLNTEIITWTSETDLESVACIWVEEKNDLMFADKDDVVICTERK